MQTPNSTKTTIMNIATLTLIPAVLLTVTACTFNGMKGQEEVDVAAVDGGRGRRRYDDPRRDGDREGCRQEEDHLDVLRGREFDVQSRADLANFDQIKVGDEITAVVTEEVAVYMGDAPTGAAAAGEVMVSPDGSRAAGMVIETQEMAVTVVAVDARKHKVTFKLPDGTTKKVKANKKIDLSQVKAGDEVTVQMGEGLALTIDTK